MPRNVKYTIVLKDRYTRVANKVARATSMLSVKMRKLRVTGKQLAKTFNDSEKASLKFGRALRKVGKNTSFLNNQMGTLVRSMGPALLMFKALQQYGQNVMMETSFGVLTGNREIGQTLNKDLMAFAATTPFTIPKVQQTAKTLLAYGIESDQILDTVRMVGEISSGTGADIGRIALAVGQVKSTGFLQGQDARQLEAAGVGIRRMVREKVKEIHGVDLPMGDVMKAVSERMIPAEFILTIMRDLTEEGGRFHKIMEELNNTLPGQFTNLQDNMIRVGIIWGGALDKTFKIKDTLKFLNDQLKEFIDNFQKNPEKYESIMTLVSYFSLLVLLTPILIGLIGSLSVMFAGLQLVLAVLNVGFMAVFGWPALIIASLWLVVANFQNILSFIDSGIEYLKRKWNQFIDMVWDAETLSVVGLIREGGSALGLWDERRWRHQWEGVIDIRDPGGMVEGTSSEGGVDFNTGQNMSPAGWY